MLTRRHGLVLAAMVTMMLVAWTAWRDSPDLPASSARVPHAAKSVDVVTGQPAATAARGEFDRDPLLEATADPFQVVTFFPPQPKFVAPPPPALPPAPVKPVAPPFPFLYFGRMVDVNGKLVTYLTRDDVLIPIRAKETLDNVYRIDAMTETEIVVTHLPSNEKVTITTQSASN